jgi:hypothetical protein
MKLVSPGAFSNICAKLGLKQISSAKIPLQKGKVFFVGFYRKEEEPIARTDGSNGSALVL